MKKNVWINLKHNKFTTVKPIHSMAQNGNWVEGIIEYIEPEPEATVTLSQLEKAVRESGVDLDSPGGVNFMSSLNSKVFEEKQ